MKEAQFKLRLHKSLLSPFRTQSAASMKGRILDCGGGVGEYLAFFSSLDVVSFDLSLQALKSLESAKKVCGDGCLLPFKDDSFDSVWACAVAQYMPLDVFINELKRVTCKGGRILVLVPNGKSPWDWIKTKLRMQSWWDQENIYTQYSVDDLSSYGVVTGEVRFLPGEKILRNFPRLCHTLMLEIDV